MSDNETGDDDDDEDILSAGEIQQIARHTLSQSFRGLAQGSRGRTSGPAESMTNERETTSVADKFKITIEGKRNNVIVSLADQSALDAYLSTCKWTYSAPGVESLCAPDGYTPITIWDRDLTYRTPDGDRVLPYGVVAGANRRNKGLNPMLAE